MKNYTRGTKKQIAEVRLCKTGAPCALQSTSTLKGWLTYTKSQKTFYYILTVINIEKLIVFVELQIIT